MPTRSVETLLADLFDYAGLFPPARLDMATMIERFAAHSRSRNAWMLGRVVAPLDRLGEFETTAAALRLAEEPASGEWTISALIGSSELTDLVADLERVHAFNRAHEATGRFAIDAVELKAPDIATLESCLTALERAGGGLLAAVEIPLHADPRGLIAAIAADEGGVVAKARTGGVTPDAIPTPASLARFLRACAASDAPFKLTAGLHHPIRAEHPLTYEAGAPRAMTHGFLNALLASAAARRDDVDGADVVALLEEMDPATFEFDEQGAAWAGLRFSVEELAATRERLLLSIGTCSFREPVRDLQALGLLESTR